MIDVIDEYGKIIKKSRKLNIIKRYIKRLELIKKYSSNNKEINKIDEYLTYGYFLLGVKKIREGKRKNKAKRAKAKRAADYYFNKMSKIIEENKYLKNKFKDEKNFIDNEEWFPVYCIYSNLKTKYKTR